MQFTPQQLAGGPKFSSTTRIGNWQEEIAMEEAKVENFQRRAASGSLSLRKLEHKIAVCTEIVPHSYSGDGFVRFGDTVILRHDISGSILACDPFERVDVSNETYMVSTIAEECVPKARNTFRIVRPPKRLQDVTDNEADPIVYIGQPFLLAANESLLVQPGMNILAPALYLASTRKSERTATKRTNRQMAYMTTTLDADAVWTTSMPSKGKGNGTERFLALGTPVSVATSYQVTHRQTNMFLTCDPSFKTQTEFGLEYECYADRSTAYGKIGLMVREFKGESTSQTLTKPDSPSFSWHFVTSKDRGASVDSRVLPTPATPENVIRQMREFIRGRGLDAFWNLRDFLHQIEKKLLVAGKVGPLTRVFERFYLVVSYLLADYSSRRPRHFAVSVHQVDREDLREAVIHWGLNFPPRYMDMALDQVDNSRMGLIDVKELLRLLRGPLSPSRGAILREVFAALDTAGEGTVSVATLQQRFRGGDHPLVSIGGFSEAYALEHFLQSLEVNRKLPTRCTYEMFADYYADLSAAVDDDGYFESIVRSNWA